VFWAHVDAGTTIRAKVRMFILMQMWLIFDLLTFDSITTFGTMNKRKHMDFVIGIFTGGLVRTDRWM
jgi:hypothetical protein